METLGNPQNTIAVLQKYKFNFQKKFGQNFLIDTHVLDKIIDAAGITEEDFVLEIGPGIGTMTQYLCENAREVVAVEIDKNLIPILEDTLSDYRNVTVINQDILKLDIPALAKEKNVRYMVAHVVRFWPGYEALKEIYDTKKYGKLISGTMQRLGQFPQWSWNNWMQKEECSGMVPFDLHIHDLDFLVYAFGIPKDKVVFRAKRSDSDFLNITYDFGDFFVQTQASWYATKDHPFTACYSFQFEDALVEFREERLKIYLRDGGVIDSGGEAGALGAIDLPQTDAYANEIRYFTDCVENGTDCEKVRAEELAAVLDILNNV